MPDGEEDRPTNSEMNATERACLLSVLSEIQQVIRAYDTKAQIVGIGFLFSIAMISNFLSQIEIVRRYDEGFLIGGFLLLVGPVVLFGAVLYPSRRLDKKIIDPPDGIRRCMYYSDEPGRSARTFLADTDGADWKAEIVYEIAKLSALRDMKRTRFLRAITAAGFCFSFILVSTFIELTR